MVPLREASPFAGGVVDPTLLEQPLRMAAAAGHARVVELLLGSGADPRSEVAGLTPVGLACAGGHLATVRLLLQWGAVFSGLDDQGARCEMTYTPSSRPARDARMRLLAC